MTTERTEEKINEIKLIWEEYKRNPDKTEELKLSILKKVEQNPIDMWHTFFSTDYEMCERIVLVENEVMAKKYKEYLKNGQILVKMIATYAHGTCEYKDDIHTGFDVKKVKVWHDIFADMPEFSKAFEDEVTYWENFRKESYAKYNLSDKPKVLPVIVETVEFNVPYNFTDDVGNKAECKPPEMIKKIIQHYNHFNLHQYMDLPFKCASTSLEANADAWLFKFNMAEKISSKDMKVLQEELKGQLSDGWGSSLSITMLVGVKEITAGFDYENMTMNNEKKEIKKMKMK